MKRTKRILICISVIYCLFFIQSVDAQIFEIKDGSKFYDAKIDVNCEKEQCDGKAKIKLYQKMTKQLVQTFDSDELTMYLDEKFKPSVNIVQLYGEQSPLIFDDFNFDGTEDLAIRNGNDGSYGGPVYDVYVLNQSRHKFILSEELSALTQDNLCMFDIDKKRKRLITYNKSGYCYHTRSEYEVVPNKRLLLVREFSEAVVTTGDKVEVIDRNLVKGKWKVKAKYYPIDQYYK